MAESSKWVGECSSVVCVAPQVLDMTKKFMNDPVKVLVKRDELTLEGASARDPTAPALSP